MDWKTPKDKIAEQSVLAIKKALEGVELWRVVDDAVRDILAEYENDDNEVQLWLSQSGKHRACIKLYGSDEPILLKFFVPGVHMPVRREYTAQIEEALESIAAIRRFAAELTEMADGAVRALRAMGISEEEYPELPMNVGTHENHVGTHEK